MDATDALDAVRRGLEENAGDPDAAVSAVLRALPRQVLTVALDDLVAGGEAELARLAEMNGPGKTLVRIHGLDRESAVDHLRRRLARIVNGDVAAHAFACYEDIQLYEAATRQGWKPGPAAYAINVRAVVTGRRVDPDPGDPENWTVYDHGSRADGTDVLRCDTLVRVTASSASEAVELAKAAAPPVDLPSWDVDGIEIWVDESVDINPGYAEGPPEAGPAP
jgi:hypothetical protein